MNRASRSLIPGMGFKRLMSEGRFVKNKSSVALFLVGKSTKVVGQYLQLMLRKRCSLLVHFDFQRCCPTSRKIFLWNKTDLEKLQHDMQAFCQSFISKFSTSHPVDSLWTAFKNGCLNVLGSNVPSKMTTMSDISGCFPSFWHHYRLSHLSSMVQRHTSQFVCF
jgi:hypothetical protein